MCSGMVYFSKMTSYYGNWRKDRTLGVVDVPCVIGGIPIQITMHVVLGEVPCLLSKARLKEDEADIDSRGAKLSNPRQRIPRALRFLVLRRDCTRAEVLSSGLNTWTVGHTEALCQA